jgi:hypothetical protein
LPTSEDVSRNKRTQQVVIEGLEPQLGRLIKSLGNNAQTIIDYTNSVRNEISVSCSYEKNNIKTLAGLSKFHSNKKFKAMQKQDILSFLNSQIILISHVFLNQNG